MLWTGGWDSTYRVLDVVLRHGHPIQPWYVLDEERASTSREVETMDRIRSVLAQRAPEVSGLLRETRYVRMEEIHPVAELSRMHRALAIGSQYDWLARMAEQRNLTRLELGAIGGDAGRLRRLLGEDVEQVEGIIGSTYQVVDHPQNPSLELFRRFQFPILDLTKHDIRREATRHGMLDLMEMTWFCHTPKDGEPCGMCTPCMVAMRSKMGWRIPPMRRIRPLLRIAKASARNRLEAMRESVP